MKKLSTLLLASVLFTAAKAQKMDGDNTFISTTNQTLKVSDTVKVGLPAPGQQAYLFIENKSDKTIKKTAKAADGVAKVGSVFGLGGLKGAITGIKVGRAARNVQTAAEAADVLNGNGIIKPEQKLVITKFYVGDDKEIFAEAVNGNKSKFTIKINQALLIKEIVTKDQNIFVQDDDEQDEGDN